jgi:hypothetical protein
MAADVLPLAIAWPLPVVNAGQLISTVPAATVPSA